MDLTGWQLGDCGEGGAPYAARMKLGRVLCVGLVSAAAVLMTGCGGVNATGTVSPATFLLPGLMRKTPEAKPPGAMPAPQVAEAFVAGAGAVGQP